VAKDVTSSQSEYTFQEIFSGRHHMILAVSGPIA